VSRLLQYVSNADYYGRFKVNGKAIRESLQTTVWTIAVQSANGGLKNLARKYQVPLMDWYGLQSAVFGSNASLHSTILVGNVAILHYRGSR
jgi:hypothetical protein